MQNSPPGIAIQPIDVAVLLLGYKRPEMLKKRISEVSKFNCVYIYISLDGGPLSHTTEMNNVKEFAKDTLVNCSLDVTHHEKNLGMTRHVTTAITNVLSSHKFVIVIEDDVILSKNFMQNILLGLNVLREEGYLGVVSGYSSFFSKSLGNRWRQVSIPVFWGWACSRDTWTEYNFELSKFLIEEDLSKSNLWKSFYKFQQQYLLSQFFKLQRDPSYTWDVQMWFHLLRNDFRSLAPIFSLSGNEGFGDARAEHTTYKMPRYMKNHKLNEKLVTRKIKYFSFFEFFNFPFLKHVLKNRLKELRNFFSKV